MHRLEVAFDGEVATPPDFSGLPPDFSGLPSGDELAAELERFLRGEQGEQGEQGER